MHRVRMANVSGAAWQLAMSWHGICLAEPGNSSTHGIASRKSAGDTASDLWPARMYLQGRERSLMRCSSSHASSQRVRSALVLSQGQWWHYLTILNPRSSPLARSLPTLTTPRPGSPFVTNPPPCLPSPGRSRHAGSDALTTSSTPTVRTPTSSLMRRMKPAFSRVMGTIEDESRCERPIDWHVASSGAGRCSGERRSVTR